MANLFQVHSYDDVAADEEEKKPVSIKLFTLG